MTLRYLSSAIALAWAVCFTAAAQQNDLAFIARPCPSNITAPQAHMVIPIVINGISIPFIICASLGPGLSLDLTGPVPILNATGSGVAGVTIALGGTTVGTQPTLNLISGNGILQVCSNNTASSRIDCFPGIDTSYIVSQDGLPRSVVATSVDPNGNPIPAGTMYRASLSPVLIGYGQNKTYVFLPNVSCGDSPALNLDGLGPIPLKKLNAGVLVPLVANDCAAGVPYLIITHFNGQTADAFVLRP